jgi:hypothetical protein
VLDVNNTTMKKLLFLALIMISCGKDPEPKIDGRWQITFTEFADPDLTLKFNVERDQPMYFYSQVDLTNSIENFGASITGDGSYMLITYNDENDYLVEIEFDYTFNGKLKFTSYSYKVTDYSPIDGPVVISDQVFTGSYQAELLDKF